MTKKKKIFFVILTLVLVCVIAGAIDFIRVCSFERPLFCIATNTADDGGSGHYVGLGYSFDIEGNFMPEDELPGVTSYSYHVWGIPVCSGSRD